MSYQGFCPIIFCKGKSPRYQGKYKLGVNQAGVRTCDYRARAIHCTLHYLRQSHYFFFSLLQESTTTTKEVITNTKMI